MARKKIYSRKRPSKKRYKKKRTAPRVQSGGAQEDEASVQELKKKLAEVTESRDFFQQGVFGERTKLEAAEKRLTQTAADIQLLKAHIDQQRQKILLAITKLDGMVGYKDMEVTKTISDLLFATQALRTSGIKLDGAPAADPN